MSGKLQWYDEEVVVRGEANHQLGIMQVTVTCFCVEEKRFELRLAWEFFTPQRILLKAGLVTGLRTRAEAFEKAEAIYLKQLGKSRDLKVWREMEGWESLH